jgi:hypothetical protein
MQSRVRLSWFGAYVALALSSLAPSTAHADVTARQCIDANNKAQPLRREHKLALAREQLLICTSTSCPGIIAKDCIERLQELETIQPSIAFEVKDAAGADLSSVKISLDGKPFTDKVDGTLFPLDPGAYTATFEAPGLPTVTRPLVITEGEKGRRERVVLGTPVAVVARRAPEGEVLQPARSGDGFGTQKLLGVVSAGAGVVGLVVGGIFGGLALSEKSNVQSLCATSCGASAHAQADSDHSSGTTDATVSTVGFIAGGALLASGAALFFTAPKPSSEAPTQPLSRSWRVVPSVGASRGGLLMQGEF